MKKPVKKLTLTFEIEFKPHNEDVIGAEEAELKAITPDILKYLEQTNLSYKHYGLQIVNVKKAQPANTQLLNELETLKKHIEFWVNDGYIEDECLKVLKNANKLINKFKP